MATKLITLFLFLSYSTFAQRLDWEKVEDISTKPLAIAGDSAQLWAVVHNGIYTSLDTGLTWRLTTEFAQKDVYSRIVAAYGIDNVLLVGLTHYQTNYTGCRDYIELKKYDKGIETPYIADAALCSVSDRFCPTSTYGEGPEFIDATHFAFRNSSSRYDGRFCVREGRTKLLSEPNKYTLNFSNIESRYVANDNNSFYRDSGIIMAISDKKWLTTVHNFSKLMYFQFDTISNIKYNLIKTRELPISSNNIKRYVHKNNRLYLFYGENKVYFTDNFGDNWQHDSLKINAEIKDLQMLDSTFILLTNKGLFKSNDLINYQPIYQNRITLPDSINSFPFRVGRFWFLNTHLYGLLRSFDSGLTWQHIEPKGLGYPSEMKAFWRGGDTITVKAGDLFFTKANPNLPFKHDSNFIVEDNFPLQLKLNNYTFVVQSTSNGGITKNFVLRSTNQPLNWDTIFTVIDTLPRFFQLPQIKKSGNRLFYFCRAVYVSENFGATWQKLFDKPVSRLFIDKNKLLIMSDSVYRSDDFGRNWIQPKGAHYLDDYTEQWANNQILTPIVPNYTYSSLYFSLNFGKTWLTRPPPPNCFNVNVSLSSPNFRQYKTYNYAYPYFSDSRYLYAFSASGGLWRTNTEGVCSEPTNVSIKDTVCQGDNYYFNGINYTQTAVYTIDKISNFNNTCDTAFTLDLTVKKLLITRQIMDTICPGNSYTFNGQTNKYNNFEGVVYKSYKSRNCDTLVELFLTVLNSPACRVKTDEALIINNLTIAPNPNSGLFSLDFELKEAQNISIELNNTTGKSLKILLNKTYLNAQKHHYLLPINDVPNGIYFLYLKSEKGILIRKIIKTD